MNRRARNRLIGVTAIILVAIAAIFFGSSQGENGGAYYKTVGQVVKDRSLVGKRVKVGGTVVAGSWDKKARPMKFRIREEKKDDGPVIAVIYDGAVPATFGDGTVAIVTGIVNEDGTIQAKDMITKCPSKYESAKTALSVTDLLASPASVGKPVKLTGYVVAGSLKTAGGAERFRVQASATGGKELPVAFDSAMPAGFKDGAKVVLGGSLDEEGTFNATSVSIAVGGGL